mmetsp:Transcript_5526/g.7788  ORF Transcript_5526/g.7788 Transcript_5526/m.7788 type:complete len:81 (-) Transcript_5526:13-255(-)
MYCIVEAALLIKQIVRSGCIYAVEKIFGIKEKEKEKQIPSAFNFVRSSKQASKKPTNIKLSAIKYKLDSDYKKIINCGDY